MIEKIIHIKNIGRFVACTSVGRLQFRRVSLIYAENARGKSTLSALLRSVSSGDCSAVIARHTLSADTPSSAELRCSGANLRYDGSQWNGKIPQILVFDAAFVGDHVYSGDAVTADHRKRLHEFAIGDKAVALVKDIARLDEVGRTLNKLLNNLEQSIQKHINGTIAVDEFCELVSDAAIDEKIDRQEKRLAEVVQADEMSRRPGLSRLNFEHSNPEDIRSLLERTISDISEGARQKTREHITARLENQGEGWLAQGYRYLKDDRCPFCDQSTEGVDLVDAYHSYFSEAYADLQAHIRGALERIAQDPFTMGLDRLEEICTENVERVNFWREKLPPDTVFPDINPIKIIDAGRRYHESMTTLIRQKERRPLDKIEVDPTVSSHVADLLEASREARIYDEAVADLDRKIDDWKRTLAESDVGHEKLKLNTLLNQRARSRKPASDLCKQYLDARLKRKRAEDEKKEVRAKLERETEDVLSKYQESINKYLEQFGASFRIGDTKSDFKGGKAKTNYRIVVNDTLVDIGNERTSPDVPSFKTILSDGDKSTLAFAFFLARLDHDDDLKSRILVIDDPISSLDIHRKHCTWQSIRRAGERARQVVVTSHDPHFLRDLWDHTIPADRSAMKIERSGDGSEVSSWDIEAETCSDYFQRVRVVTEWLDDPKQHPSMLVAKSLRVLLEANLRVRFPRSFDQNDWLGGFIGKIRNATPSDPLDRMKSYLNELSDLNDYSKNFHHDQNPHADTTRISEIELSAFAKRTLTFLGA